MMTSVNYKLKLRSLGTHQHELGNASNFGRKLLEKMGWQDGLGLGRNNQGMVENPLWNYRRKEQFKGGFKSKDEIFERETLVHQNAFEDLLGDLNAQICKGSEVLCTQNLISRDTAKVPTRRPRYFKMACAKDISNYSIKDLEGIIGRDVTKKNLSLLLRDRKGNKTICNTESEKDADYQITLDDSKLDKVKIKKHKRKRNKEKNVEINTSADQSLNIVHEDLTVKEDNLSKDADTRNTLEDWNMDEVMIKKSKKRKRNREENVEINSLVDPILNIVHDNLSVGEDNLSKDLKVNKVKIKKCKRKRNSEINVGFNTPADTSSNIVNEIMTVKGDNMSKVDSQKEFCCEVSQVAEDEDFMSQICHGFIGSNLSSIKGYGNW